MESGDIDPMSVKKKGFLQISRFMPFQVHYSSALVIRFFAMSSATPHQGVNPCEHHQQQVPGPVHVQVQQPWEQQQQEPKETHIKRRTQLH